MDSGARTICDAPGAPREHAPSQPLRIAVVTGTRAEFGLLLPVIEALRSDPRFEVGIVCAGMHLVPGVDTWREVEARAGIDARVGMQEPDDGGAAPGDGSVSAARLSDAAALGRGICGFASALPAMFNGCGPDWVLVLGDRIEAFAGAAAASVGGIGVAHLHGGDRAEGVADEAMRHAITKLAHLHLPATACSAARIERMGEPRERIVTVGSPAMCGLDRVRPLEALPPGVGTDDCTLPGIVVLHHPSGLDEASERALARAVGEGVRVAAKQAGSRVLWLAPNADPGSALVREEIGRASEGAGWITAGHMPRAEFLALLAALASSGGVLVGNSSSGLIEAAGLRVGVVNCGPRQRGRERAGNVVDVGERAWEIDAHRVREAIARARAISGRACAHPYGDGDAAQRIGEALHTAGRPTGASIRKHNAY